MLKIKLPDTQLEPFLNALENEDDRGAALAAAAFAEEILGNILRSFLADEPSTEELISGFSAPIGTLAVKAKLAYSMGLLDRKLFDSIDTLRRIRNEFAHKWTPVSFDSTNIRRLINGLPDHPILEALPPINKPRDKFDSHVAALLLELSLIPTLVKGEKRTPKRIIRFGKFHATKEEAEAEDREFRRTGIPPWIT